MNKRDNNVRPAWATDYDAETVVELMQEEMSETAAWQFLAMTIPMIERGDLRLNDDGQVEFRKPKPQH
jgi:hypothetical protein